MLNKRQFKTLRSRLLFWFFLSSLPPLLLTAFLIYARTAKSIKEEAFHKLSAIRDLKVQQIQMWMDERMADIHGILDEHELRPLEKLLRGETGSRQEEMMIKDKIRRILGQHISHCRDYDEVFLLNAFSGKVEISTVKSREGEDRSLDPYFTGPMRSGEVFLKDVYLSRTRNRASMAISLPLFSADPAEEIMGILVIQLDLRRSLYGLLLDRAGMGQTGETLVVNGDAVALSDLRWHPGAPLRFTIETAPAWKASRGKTGLIEVDDYRGERVLAAYAHIPKIHWGFVAKQDMKEVYWPVRRMINNILIILSAALPALYALAFFVSLSLSKRLERLSVAVSDIAEGCMLKGVEVSGSDEIAQLGECFNRMMDRLSSSYKELEAFSYSVSHDLRAPLRGIDGFSQVLLEDYEGKLDEAGKDCLREIRNSARQMGALIDSLLNLSRITRREMKIEAVDLSSLARPIAEKLKKKELERPVEYLIEEGITGRGDTELLRALLWNLLENAWKFTRKSPQPRIEFGESTLGKERVFYVKDNGAGFDMAYADKLFGAFQRLHSQIEFEGTGIGLATVHRIVSRHGGRIWAEGKRGEGAVFYFTLENG